MPEKWSAYHINRTGREINSTTEFVRSGDAQERNRTFDDYLYICADCVQTQNERNQHTDATANNGVCVDVCVCMEQRAIPNVTFDSNIVSDFGCAAHSDVREWFCSLVARR